MNVKKMAETTFWLIVFFVGMSFLLPTIRQDLPYEIILILEPRLHSQYFIGSFFPFLVNIAFWIMIAFATLDAILNNKLHFELLGSFSVILVLGITTIILAITPLVTPYIFWGILQVIAILGTYSTFRKLMHNIHSGGQKMMSFIKGIKNGGGSPKGHIADHYIVFIMGLVLLAVGVVQILSLLIYTLMHWNSLIW